MAALLQPFIDPPALTQARGSELLAQALAVPSKGARATLGGGRGYNHGRESRAPFNSTRRISGAEGS